MGAREASAGSGVTAPAGGAGRGSLSLEEDGLEAAQVEARRWYSRKRSRCSLTDRLSSAFVQSKCARSEDGSGGIADMEKRGVPNSQSGIGAATMQATGEAVAEENGDEVVSVLVEVEVDGGQLVTNKNGICGNEPGSSGEEADIDSSSGGSGSGERASRRAHKLRAAVVCKDGHLPPQGQQHEGDCMVASRLLQLWTAVPVVREHRRTIGPRQVSMPESHHGERVAVPC